MQRLFRSNLNKHARAGIVQRAEALNKLDRRRDLLRENVEHLWHSIRPHGIKLAVGVGDDGQTRRLQVQTLENLPQRFARSRYDRRVERVADR